MGEDPRGLDRCGEGGFTQGSSVCEAGGQIELTLLEMGEESLIMKQDEVQK